jgi:V/A-type H+/Na+-transporting ATPase subunit A
MDSLSPTDRMLLEAARMIREDFLHQNAFDDIDTYTSMRKQFLMLDIIMEFYQLASQSLTKGADLDKILALPIQEQISRAKLIEEAKLDTFNQLKEQMADQFKALFMEKSRV